MNILNWFILPHLTISKGIQVQITELLYCIVDIKLHLQANK